MLAWMLDMASDLVEGMGDGMAKSVWVAVCRSKHADPMFHYRLQTLCVRVCLLRVTSVLWGTSCALPLLFPVCSRHATTTFLAEDLGGSGGGSPLDFSF
jgi:hypothetical protein